MNLKNREKKLLLLLLEQECYKSAAFFTESLNVSAKTIYSDLEKLQAEVQSLGLSIVKVPRKGIKIEGSFSDRQKIKGLLTGGADQEGSSYTPSFRRLTIFSNALFAKERRSYAQLAEAFFVSIPSIQKDVSEVLLFCQDKGVQITELPQLSDPRIDESLIQRTYLEYLEIYLSEKTLTVEQELQLFREQTLKIVELFLAELFIGETALPNEYMLVSLRRSLMVILNRVKNDCHIENSSTLLFKELEKMQLYMTAIRFSDLVNQELGIIFQRTDIYYVCSLLFAHGIRPFTHGEDKAEDVSKDIRDLITSMSKMIGSDLSQDEHLFNSLLAHIVPMIYRLKIGISIKNPLKDEIIKQYSTMYTLAGYAIVAFEEKLQIKITEEELSFLTIHFQLAFEKIKNVRHVLIVCPSGLGTSQFIYQRIKQMMPADIILEISNFHQIFDNDLTDVDLVISTVRLEDIGLPIVYVSPLPTTSEINEINQQLLNLQINEKKFISKEIKVSHSLKKFLTEEFIVIGLDAHTQTEVVNCVADLYQEAEIVDTNFQRAVLEREALGTTGLISGVAIPHIDPKSVKETKIAVVTLKRPITWGQNQISLVIFLTIAEKDIELAKDIVASLYEMLSSKDRVQEIAKSATKQELISNLTQKGVS